VVVFLIGMVVLAVFLVGAFWYGLRGEPNEPPALGHNFPYPGTAWGHMPSADDIQTEDPDPRPSRSRRPRHGSSWMDEPGALEEAGLVDEPADSETDTHPLS